MACSECGQRKGHAGGCPNEPKKKSGGSGGGGSGGGSGEGGGSTVPNLPKMCGTRSNKQVCTGGNGNGHVAYHVCLVRIPPGQEDRHKHMCHACGQAFKP